MRFLASRAALLKLAVSGATIALVTVLALTGGQERARASASGPAASHTGAPGENNCTSCHSQFPANSGIGGVTITGVPHDYLPGQQIAITVRTDQADAVLWGFQMTALDSLGREAGTFSLPTQMPAQTQIVNGLVGGVPRKYVEHTQAGLFTNGVFGYNAWTFTWTAPAQRIGKIGFYAAGNGANSDGSTTGDYIYTTETASLSGSATSNFDGDLESDIAVFRPSTGVWYSFSILNGTYSEMAFGLPGDKIAPGDYDGDGKTDHAVFRPSNGTWYIQRSTLGPTGVQFGASGDLPAAADYDGDGKTDVALYRPSTGVWYLFQSTAGVSATVFGLNGDKPTPGDYDADGKADIAVYRPSDGTWYLNRSTAGITATQFGIAEDKPVQFDYDGDGKTDIAVFRPSNGAWYVIKSRDGLFGMTFGFATDRPAPADYDGDGKTDIAVYRPSENVWYLALSADNSYYATVFGLTEDLPVAGGYIPE